MAESVQGERVFEGVRFDVHALSLPGAPGGPTVRREMVVTADAVVVVPVLDDSRVVMIRNERFVVDETLWELCAGTIEPGEAPLVAAKREMEEETGYRAGAIEPMVEFFPSPGICTERMHAFVARDLTHVGQNLDESERIEVEVLALSRIMRMIREGEIRDGKTIAALLYYDRFARGEEGEW